MIALHRFQTEGQVSYRRLLGMHGGGGGTSSAEFKTILAKKMENDIKTHYAGEFPDGGYWPNPVPNSPPPVLLGGDHEDLCFAYTFCWHAEPQFLLWHRPLLAEFERGLQYHDPKYNTADPDKPDHPRYTGKDALGAPYWAWEGWDGLSLPQFVSNPVYIVKTDVWENNGFKKGSCFNNPFYRWLAPVDIEAQKQEFFPDTLTNENTTQRAAAFDDQGAEFTYQWPQVTAPKNPSMKDVVNVALSNPNWNTFCTVKVGGNWSIENAHNKFHNHIGGLVLGGTQGSGVQKDAISGGEFTGTMAQNQSIFDPIFWLHHCNVERQFMSWQRAFVEDSPPREISTPPLEQMETVLYPWTKPENLFKGQLSWNTESTVETDGTFGDWWNHQTLPYSYDEYLQPFSPYKGEGFTPRGRGFTPTPTPQKLLDAIRMNVIFDAAENKGGEYVLWNGEVLVGIISILSARGSLCARCAGRTVGKVCFEVSDTFSTIEAAKNAKNLKLTRNGNIIEIQYVEVEKWNNPSDNVTTSPTLKEIVNRRCSEMIFFLCLLPLPP
jgi:hypothetical protein